jgi:predicted RND superfamily exporter protein
MGAVFLLRHDRRGPASAIALLTFVTVMGLGVVGSFGYAAARGEAIDPFVTAMFAIIIGVGAMLLALGLWPTHAHRIQAHPAHV